MEPTPLMKIGRQHTAESFDAYSILGVPEDADLFLIDDAWRRSVINCHPDKFTDPAEKAIKEDEFKTLLLAYDTLSREHSRAKHDHDRRSRGFRSGRDHDVGTFKMRSGAVAAENSHGAKVKAREADSISRQGVHSRQASETDRGRKRPREPGMLVTVGLIQHHRVHAMPDTGAGLNLISSSLAAELGYSRPPDLALRGAELRMANGKHLKTIGVIEAAWSFFQESKKAWSLMFHIVEDFSYDAVLGNDFLMSTQTMSKHQHRLCRVPVPMKALSVVFVNTLGKVNQRVRGFINDVEVYALPDSGSESNLLSFDYCRAKGWDESLELEDTRLLLFPDGSIQQTLGTIRLKWHYGNNRNSLGIMLDFHVLFGCVYDAILGQDMLEETLAFEWHQDSFMKVQPDQSAQMEQSELNLVIWLPFRRAKRKASEAGLAEDNNALFGAAATSVHNELERRAAADSAMRRLPQGSEREQAMTVETERRRRYDEVQGQHHHDTTSSFVMSLGRPALVNVPGRNDSSRDGTSSLNPDASVAPWSRF